MRCVLVREDVVMEGKIIEKLRCVFKITYLLPSLPTYIQLPRKNFGKAISRQETSKKRFKTTDSKVMKGYRT